MAKTKFQNTLKNGLTGATCAGKKIAGAVESGASVAISKGKEQLDKANQKKDEVLSSQQMVDILDVCYGKALDGIPKVSKSVNELAEDYSSKYPTAEKSCKGVDSKSAGEVYDIRIPYRAGRNYYAPSCGSGECEQRDVCAVAYDCRSCKVGRL